MPLGRKVGKEFGPGDVLAQQSEEPGRLVQLLVLGIHVEVAHAENDPVVEQDLRYLQLVPCRRHVVVLKVSSELLLRVALRRVRRRNPGVADQALCPPVTAACAKT